MSLRDSFSRLLLHHVYVCISSQVLLFFEKRDECPPLSLSHAHSFLSHYLSDSSDLASVQQFDGILLLLLLLPLFIETKYSSSSFLSLPAFSRLISRFTDLL